MESVGLVLMGDNSLSIHRGGGVNWSFFFVLNFGGFFDFVVVVLSP